MTGIVVVPSASGLIRDEVYRTVVDRIVAGGLLPGDRLSERRLAAELGVGRMPVKEAIRRLETEGFVSTRPRSGTVIATSVQDSVQDAVQVRAVLEGLAAGLVAAGSGAPIRAELADLVARMRALSRPAAASSPLSEVNGRFHELIRRCCGNRFIEVLPPAVSAVDGAVRRRALTDAAELRLGVREHAAIAERIVDGDQRGAEECMRAHILRSGAFVVRQLTVGR
jgi:DNA-binding GntR family transcriptional regulator